MGFGRVFLVLGCLVLAFLGFLRLGLWFWFFCGLCESCLFVIGIGAS